MNRQPRRFVFHRDLMRNLRLGTFGPCVRISVREPLADHALQRPRGQRGVIYAKRDAVAVAEVELSGVAVKMLLRAVLVDTLHAALEDAVEALDGLGMHGAVLLGDVLAPAVRDAAMIGEGVAQHPV